jgi:hypothetical protein
MPRTSKPLSTLKKLIREHPTIADVFLTMSDKRPIEDRATAIMSAVELESALEEALINKMIPLSTEDIAGMFVGDSAPLSTFSAKIRICHALGIFGPKTRAELTVIRSIRNAFAHARKPIHFSTEEVAIACAKLTYPERMRRPSVAIHPLSNPWPPTDPRERYVHTTDGLKAALVLLQFGTDPDLPLD